MKILIPIITVLLIISCSKERRINNKIIAKVESSELTLAEAERLKLTVSNKNFSINDVVSSWVDRELLYLAAKQGGLESDEILNSQVDAYRKELFGGAFMDNYLGYKIAIENTEIKTYYDKNRSSFKHKNDGARIMHFFTKTDSTAKYIANILQQSNNSIDRKELLANFDIDITIVERGSLIERLDSEIFSNNRINNVIGPIKTEYGYHVVEVLGRFSAGSQIALDEAYDEIYQRIFNQKKALSSLRFLDSLRNQYTVKINIENN